jgi:hypothetical protein
LVLISMINHSYTLLACRLVAYQNWTIFLSFTFQYYILNFACSSLQLLLSSWKRSFIPGICGLIAGSLYRLNVLGIRRMKVIRALFSFYTSNNSMWILLHLSSCNGMRSKIDLYFSFVIFVVLVFLLSCLACLEWCAKSY